MVFKYMFFPPVTGKKQRRQTFLGEKKINDDDDDLPGEFTGSARFAFAKMSINTRNGRTDSGEIDIYFYIFYFSHRQPALLSYWFYFPCHWSRAVGRWQNFMRIGFTFWNSFIKSKCQGLAGHPREPPYPGATSNPANHLPPNSISFLGVPANASDFHLTLMMFIYFGENGKYTKYICEHIYQQYCALRK